MASIYVALLLVAGLAGLLLRWSTTPDAVAPVQAQAVDTARQDLLVDAAWLDQRLTGDTPPVVVDLGTTKSYEREHIPGAIHAWWQDALDPYSDAYGSALRVADNPYTLTALAPNLGATEADTIVVYDNADGAHAAWFVWRLRASGYPHAVVLDGGLAAWKGAGLRTTDEPALPRDIATPDPSWDTAHWDKTAEIGTDELRDRLNDPSIVVIDARTASQVRDTVNDTMPLGRIPGSRSLPSDTVVRPDGTFLGPDELAPVLVPLNLQPDNEIVVYGRFGIDTGRVWLALRLAGYEHVRVYNAGWQTWSSTEGLPTEALPQT